MKEDLLFAGGQMAVCAGLILLAVWDNLRLCLATQARTLESIAQTANRCVGMGFVALGFRKRLVVMRAAR
jgi:hypothetical protein